MGALKAVNIQETEVLRNVLKGTSSSPGDGVRLVLINNGNQSVFYYLGLL